MGWFLLYMLVGIVVNFIYFITKKYEYTGVGYYYNQMNILQFIWCVLLSFIWPIIIFSLLVEKLLNKLEDIVIWRRK